MPTPTASKLPAPLGYLARQTLTRRAAAAAVKGELARFDAQMACSAARARIPLARELARFKQLEATYPPKMHRMADAEGKTFEHKDREYLARWIAEKDQARAADLDVVDFDWDDLDDDRDEDDDWDDDREDDWDDD